jgi:uncharacterized membrane protein YdcZ (DUF606 family)
VAAGVIGGVILLREGVEVEEAGEAQAIAPMTAAAAAGAAVMDQAAAIGGDRKDWELVSIEIA